MNKVDKIELYIKQHEGLLRIAHDELKAAVLNALWQCPFCKKRSKLSKVKLEMPIKYSYTDEKWYNTQLQAYCPKCRITSRPGIAKKNFALIEKYKHLLNIQTVQS